MYRVRMASGQLSSIRGLRLSATTRRLLLALCSGTAALVLLLIHVFTPLQSLQVASLGLTGLSFAAIWMAILVWRMPVFSGGVLWTFTIIWCAGLALAITLVVIASASSHATDWKVAVQWLAFSISLCVGGLQFRALFNRRATPILGRSLSLLSPMIVLVLILVLSLNAS